MKKALVFLLVIVMVIVLAVGCANNKGSDETAATAQPQESASGDDTAPAAKDTYELAFVIPGTDSQYWNQYCGTGVKNAIIDIQDEYGVTVNMNLTGPSAEGATDEYLNILEGVIAKKLDVIITATMEPEGTAPLIKEAHDQGIFVNLFSLGISEGYEENYGALYYCNQPEQGKLAAEEIVRQLNEKNIPLEGTVGMHLATSVPVLEEKMQMFVDTMAELAPNITVLDTLYNENDVAKAQANVETQISTYGDDLIGFFGGNNLSGDGIVLAVQNAGIKDRIASVAVDSDDIEIQGLKDGTLGGIIVQTPYAQAYNATYDALKGLITGEYVQEDLMNYPADVVTLANMEEPDYAALLNPLILAKEQ